MGFDIFILFSMVFLHIVDDYYLQGWLASAKQKSWWKENAPDELYKNDYRMALFMHGFSWSFMIMLAPTLTHILSGELYSESQYVIFLVLNCAIHCFVDDCKANKKVFNLVEDQFIHLIQVFVTWVLFYVV